MDEFEMTTAGINVYFAGMTLAHYVVFAHILGGPLIASDSLQELFVLLQLPILIGAVFMVNYPKGFLSIGQHMELWASIVVLVGLVVFMVFGAGNYSIDAKRRREMEAAHLIIPLPNLNRRASENRCPFCFYYIS